jgi:L-threonylcarbamoyladenylate synthase
LSEADACVRALRRGDVVAAPTDTYFGLLADPLSDRALAALGRLKKCDAARPWPLLIPAGFDVRRLGCELSPAARRLADRFWPGKLTLVVPCDGPLGSRVGRGVDGAVGLRVPGGPRALLELLRLWDGPLTGTSANPTAKTPALNAAQTILYFPEALGCVLSGSAPGGAPSTVVDTVCDPVRVVRAGDLSEAEIREALQP